MHSGHLIAIILLSSLCAQAQTTVPGLRDWRDQQGRTIKAALVKAEGANVVLTLENGAAATVPLSHFSTGDQAFVRQQRTTPASFASPDSAASKPLAWPPIVSINKKDLAIITGEQDISARQCVYRSGAFQFVSQAPLTGTVMRDIASDFELTSALFRQLPWGWIPKPRDGKPFFVAKLFETEKDFIVGGGTENSSGGSKDDYIITKFSTLGLKKVGERYAFDAKLADGGAMIALITRLLISDMRGLSTPWSALGLEQFLEHVAYRNGSFVFTSPERALKVWLERRRSGTYTTNVDRLIARLKSPWSALVADSTTAGRIETNTDALLLFYYFGFLDDDGKGARLHHYYSIVSNDELAYRQFNESGKTGPPLSWTGTLAEHAIELNKKFIIADRPDDKLRELMIAKFKSIGIKL